MKRKTKTSASSLTCNLEGVVVRWQHINWRGGKRRQIMALRAIFEQNLWKNLPKK